MPSIGKPRQGRDRYRLQGTPQRLSALCRQLPAKETIVETSTPEQEITDDEFQDALAKVKTLRWWNDHDGESLWVDELGAVRVRLEREANRRRLLFYTPYSKQLEFHAAGLYRERLLMAANRVGKTLAGGMETAMHLTGRYAAWWPGKRFSHPISGWAGGAE